jgi:simple sugar transport system permease protein
MFGWRLEKGSAPWWLRTLIPILSIIITFILTAALLVVARANPFAAFYAMLIEPLTAPVSALEVLVKATPLLLTGLAVVFAFRCGYYNIGAEGQLYAGALAAAWIGQLSWVGSLPAPIVIALMLVGGFLDGMAWALTPAVLRTRPGVDEVVTTLLHNTVMLYLVNAILNGFWLDPVTNWPQSPRIAPSAEYPVIVPGSRVHLGLVVGVVVMFVLWWVLTRTPLGLRLRAVGLNKDAARFMGVSVGRMTLVAALVSGGIAGLAGVGEVAGIHHRLLEDISPGYGYSGIVIATLGALNPFGVGLAACFIALIEVGGQSVSRQLGIPTFLADVVQATILLVTLALLLLTGYRMRRKTQWIKPSSSAS